MQAIRIDPLRLGGLGFSQRVGQSIDAPQPYELLRQPFYNLLDARLEQVMSSHPYASAASIILMNLSA
jgi:hypothetical protein